MKKLLSIAIAVAGTALVGCATTGQNINTHITAKTPLYQGEMGFPEFIQPDIKGAPKLSDPMLVMGSTKPVMTAKHGLAAPALWDWNNDGKRDLLIGEFETGGEELGDQASTIRVYLNVGTDSNPQFSDTWEYARDNAGNVMFVDQWCCIGFTPQFVDLDSDGTLDMITGQYHPGEITWFRGAEGGFEPGIKLEQHGNPAANGNAYNGGSDNPVDPESFNYWNYSSASFGDFDNDGLQDLVVGGTALRISKNIGTAAEPKFGKREYLLDINGEPLKMHQWSEAEIVREREKWGEEWEPSVSGSGKIQQVVVDWDNDGVLDILATDYYLSDKSRAVSFFRGVKTKDGHRFEPGVDLLQAVGGGKALPGSGNRLYVDDWNQDGIQDLIIGASIVTVRNDFHDTFSWKWESDTGIQSAGKDAGKPAKPDMHPGTYEEFVAEMKERFTGPRAKFMPSDEVIKERYESSKTWYYESLAKGVDPSYPDDQAYRHQGRVYVLLGK